MPDQSARPTAARRVMPTGLKKLRIPFGPAGGAGTQTGEGESAEITSVSPDECVSGGTTATASGVNLGSSRLESGYTRGIRLYDEPPTTETATGYLACRPQAK